MKKLLSGKPATSTQERQVKKRYVQIASEWLKAEVVRSGMSRKNIAQKMSESRGREISEVKLGQMLNGMSNDQGFIFEICEIIGVQPVTVKK